MRRLHARLLLAKTVVLKPLAVSTELLKARPTDAEAQLLLGQALLGSGKHRGSGCSSSLSCPVPKRWPGARRSWPGARR